MRDTLLWLFVIAVLYLNPPFLDYNYWLGFFPKLRGGELSVQPVPAPEPVPEPEAKEVRRPSPKPVPVPEKVPTPSPAPTQETRPLSPLRTGRPMIGDSIDGFNGVAVYYNGSSRNVVGRHTAPDGYNFGLKYQCVEFVKRYYYQHLNHKMPNAWGHAKAFYYPLLDDGELNADRNLYQFSNPSRSRPRVHDILVFKGRSQRDFGHVAIVTRVTDRRVYIIQQNAGAPKNTRTSYRLYHRDGKWYIRHKRLLGWLRAGAA